MWSSSWKRPPHFSWRVKRTTSSSQEESRFPKALCHHKVLKVSKMYHLTQPTVMLLVFAGEAGKSSLLPPVCQQMSYFAKNHYLLVVSTFFTTFPTVSQHTNPSWSSLTVITSSAIPGTESSQKKSSSKFTGLAQRPAYVHYLSWTSSVLQVPQVTPFSSPTKKLQ